MIVIIAPLLREPLDSLFLFSTTNTRTILTSWPIPFLMWNMPYHVEHHLYPSIPYPCFATGTWAEPCTAGPSGHWVYRCQPRSRTPSGTPPVGVSVEDTLKHAVFVPKHDPIPAGPAPGVGDVASRPRGHDVHQLLSTVPVGAARPSLTSLMRVRHPRTPGAPARGDRPRAARRRTPPGRADHWPRGPPHPRRRRS